MPKFEIRRSDGRVQGPFSGTEIRAMAESGRIAPTDELRSQGSEKWVPASKVRGVREHLSPGTLDFSGFDAGGTPSPDPQSFGAPDWSDPEPPPAAASEPAEEPLSSPAPPGGGERRPRMVVRHPRRPQFRGRVGTSRSTACCAGGRVRLSAGAGGWFVWRSQRALGCRSAPCLRSWHDTGRMRAREGSSTGLSLPVAPPWSPRFPRIYCSAASFNG